MPTLEKNNISLNTTPDFSVQIEDQGSFAKFDNIQGAKAIGGSIPANDHNRQQLRNPDRFEKMGEINDRKFMGYVLRHDGQPILPGTLVIEETTKTSYSWWLRDIVGDLAERIKGKYINQTNLGGEKTFVNKQNYDPDTDDYCCPKVFNRHFWRDRGKTVQNTKEVKDLEGNVFKKKEDIGKLTLQHLTNEQYFVNCPGGDGVIASGENNAPVVSPFLFLWKAVEMIFWDQQIQVTENFLKTDPDLKRLCIYHTWNIARQQFTTILSFFTMPDYFMDNYSTLEAAQITNISWTTEKFQYKDLLPQMELGEFLTGLQNKLNIIFDFNGIDEVRILDRETVLTSEAFDLEQYAVGEWELGNRKDVTIVLRSEIDSNDAAFSDNWQDLSDIKQYIKDPVTLRSDLPLPLFIDPLGLSPKLDDIRLVTAEDTYYQYHWFTPESKSSDDTTQQEDILGWEPITIRFQPYFFNDGDRDQEEIKSSFGTLRQSLNGYPIAQQQGNSTAFKTRFSQFSPRLFFYLGDENASYQTSNLSLDYDTDNGLVNKRFRFTLPFLANALPGKRVFKLPASIFYYVRNNKNAIPFRTAEGSFIIDKITAVAERSLMIEAEIEVLKREDNFWNFDTGATPGTGGVVLPAFVPKYIGVNSYGKPFLISATGVVKSPPAWNGLSTSKNAGTWCVDYSPDDYLLFVGCAGGILAIFDLSNVDNLQMRTIKVLPSGEICSVSLANGHVVIGKAGGKYIYDQPYFSTLAAYADNQAVDTGAYDSNIAGCLNHALYWDGVYYGFTDRGEINISTNLRGWEQTMDWVTCFNRAVITDTKIWALSDNDRSFWKLKSSGPHGAWTEWDITGNGDPTIIESVPLTGDNLLCILNVDNQGTRLVVDPANNNNLFTPPLAKQCRGAAFIGTKVVISMKETFGSTKLAISNAPPEAPGWSYIVVPDLFQKLFGY